MCGLFGFSLSQGAVSKTKIPMLGNALGYLNDKRGGHSWGVATRGKDSVIEITRGLGLIAKASVNYNTSCAIGHTRFATTGDKTLHNAHPFEEGSIVGSHNGMIFNHKELNESYGRDHECDSAHLISHLANDLDFDDIQGYGTLTWFDERNGMDPMLCRMSAGSLSVRGIGNSADAKGVIWSSSDEHLELAVNVLKIDTFEYEVEEGQVYRASPNGLFEMAKRIELADRTQYYTDNYNDKDLGPFGFNMWDSNGESDVVIDSDTEPTADFDQDMDRDFWLKGYRKVSGR